MWAWEFFTNLGGWFLNLVRSLAPGIVGRVAVSLGIGVSSYTLLIPEALEWIQGYFNTLSAETLNLLGFLWVDKAFNLFISAVATKFSLNLKFIRLGGSS